MNPNDAKAWYNHGNALIRAYQYREAVDSFDRTVALNPQNHRAWYNRGIALAALRRYEEALNSLDTTIMIKRDCHYAWNYRGVVLNKLGRYEEAIRSFDKSLKYKHENPNAWYGKASTYAICQEVNLSLSNLRRAIELSPNLYRVMAQTDNSFDAVRQEASFRELVYD